MHVPVRKGQMISAQPENAHRQGYDWAMKRACAGRTAGADGLVSKDDAIPTCRQKPKPFCCVAVAAVESMRANW